ncbi:hypothetical protein Drorol1_Dr00013643 [Drosera rotundifolia]
MQRQPNSTPQIQSLFGPQTICTPTNIQPIQKFQSPSFPLLPKIMNTTNQSAILIMLTLRILQPTCSTITTTTTISNHLYPVILVPGSGGNQLEARLTAAYKPSSLLCKAWRGRCLIRDSDAVDDEMMEKDGWYRIWFDPTVLVGPFTKCFSERMMLYYDGVSDDYYNAPGVEIRVPNFGSTKSLLYLDPSLKQITVYMAHLVESLKSIGYSDGSTLFGAPYDFRYGLANEGQSCRVGSKYLKDLTHLIEQASASNGGNPVIIVSHSLGGLFALQLLTRRSPSWRQKYVKHFIALSAPWGGTVQEMATFASGYTLGVPLVNPLLVRQEQRSSESNLWLMPSPKVFRSSNPLVITPNATYTAKDITKFLGDIGFSEGIHPYKTRIVPLTERFEAPNVPITCVIGSGVKTPETLFYGDKGFDEQPDIVYGDGDGTVNMVSLLALEEEWRDEKNQTIEVIKLDGVSHTEILRDRNALDEVLRIVRGLNSDITHYHKIEEYVQERTY